MELGHTKTIPDHAGEDIGGFARVLGINPDASAELAGFEELHIRLEHAPIRHGFGRAVDLHVIEDAAEGVGTAAERFGIAMVDDAALVDKEQGIAHLAEF